MDMRAVPFVDAHLHFWDPARLRYPWLTPPFSDDGPNGSVEAIASPYRAEEYRRDSGGWTVAGAVHVEAGADPADALGETDWLVAEADRTGLPDALVAFADLSAPDAAAQLTMQAARRGVRGIRQILNWHADPRRTYTAADRTRDPDWIAGYAALAEHALSFDLQCYPEQMTRFAAIAADVPQVPVIINHMGMPVLDDPDGIGQWRRGLEALAALPHVAIKLSGMGFVRRNWDAALVLPLLREAIAIFGPTRVLAASDFPTDRLFADFDRTLGVLASAIAHLDDNQRRAIWGENCRRVYRIDAANAGATT